MALISTIIPCYNVANYIDRCLNSIITQTIGLDNLEIILINDASTDTTYDTLLKWEQKYPNQILVINLTQNQKQGYARNIGIQYATSEFISFVDGDDWIEPDMYEIMLTKMLTYHCDLVHCKLRQDTSEKLLSKAERRMGEDFLMEIQTNEDRCNLIVSAAISGYPTNKLYRKKMLIENNIRFIENIYYEDIYFLGLLNLYVNKIYYLNEVLYHYFFNEHSTSRIRNHEKHYDILKVCLIRWEEYARRNFLDLYRPALEYEFLERYYFTGMIRLLQNMDTLPYEIFCNMRNTLKEKIPDYHQNIYIKNNCTSELSVLLLTLLEKELPQEAWNTIEKDLRALLLLTLKN